MLASGWCTGHAYHAYVLVTGGQRWVGFLVWPLTHVLFCTLLSHWWFDISKYFPAELLLHVCNIDVFFPVVIIQTSGRPFCAPFLVWCWSLCVDLILNCRIPFVIRLCCGTVFSSCEVLFKFCLTKPRLQLAFSTVWLDPLNSSYGFSVEHRVNSHVWKFIGISVGVSAVAIWMILPVDICFSQRYNQTDLYVADVVVEAEVLSWRSFPKWQLLVYCLAFCCILYGIWSPSKWHYCSLY